MATHGIAPWWLATPAVGATRHFARHLGEMLLAMVVGMMVLGALDRAIVAAAGASVDDLQDTVPEGVALVMAFNMTVGMTVWMRHRGHSWARVAEMAGAMFVPAIAAIVLFWCAVIHSESILTLEHAAMLPAMVAVMLLHRSEYSRPVHFHGADRVG
jgi:cytochrome bd-type quinol oxidase subunit 2